MNYDLIIVGAGPAGLTAGIYALRAGLKVLLIEKAGPGGQIAITPKVENYPGYISISGFTLSANMFEQATNLGLETTFDEVVEYDILGKEKKVKTISNLYIAKAIIIAVGANERELEVENEKKLIGRGVSYCATCDGAFFRGKDVAIVGGGNTSFDDCIYLSGVANKVYLIHRRNEFRAEERLVNKVREIAKNTNKVEFVLSSVVEKLIGDDKLSGIEVKNLVTNENRKLDVEGIFVAIGRKPGTELLQNVLNLTKDGYIITDEDMKTNIEGVFAAGDVRQKSLRQIVTATADGAMAAISAHHYIRG